MMPEPADYSVAALRWFADQLPEISQLPTKTARRTPAWRSARSWPTSPSPTTSTSRTIDADDVLDQFEDATADRYTVNTRQTYRTGFHRGLELFQRWQNHDPAWDTDIARRIRRRPTADAVIVHTFPVRAGITTRFALPVDLTGRRSRPAHHLHPIPGRPALTARHILSLPRGSTGRWDGRADAGRRSAATRQARLRLPSVGGIGLRLGRCRRPASRGRRISAG